MKKKVLLIAIALSACGSDSVDPSIVDTNQIISKDNATLNGKAYMREVFAADGESVTFMSDSTIGPSCRYGDGWVSGKIRLKNQNVVDIKCQSNGSGKGTNGCMTKDEFFTKEYAAQEGKCDKSLTSLKKLGG